jgi:hypothetical protein
VRAFADRVMELDVDFRTSSKSPVPNRSRMARWIDGKFSESPTVNPLVARIA